MLKIAICDDEETSVQLNKALTEKILNEENVQYEIQTFQNMQDMLDALTKYKTTLPFDVLLCDILTTDMNGIDAAERLRQLGDQLDIIFISSTAEYALDGYRVQALRYIQKPVNIDILREALMISNRKHVDKEGLTINAEGRMLTISFKDILYIESCARDVDIHIANKVITTHIKISDMEKMVPEKDFFRCHRSYIVNLSNMSKIERYEITMNNKERVPVSQQMYSETKMRFSKHQ